MWPIKLNFKNCLRKIKACATAGVSLHIILFLSNLNLMVLINTDLIFEIIFCSTRSLIQFAKDVIMTHRGLPLDNYSRLKHYLLPSI